MMTVADPAQHYFFNYNPSLGHLHFLLDYTVTVKIRGGTTASSSNWTWSRLSPRIEPRGQYLNAVFAQRGALRSSR